MPIVLPPRSAGVHLLVLAHLALLGACGGGTPAPAEDPAAKAKQVLELKAQGVIDDADARVMLGLAKDREEALAQLASQTAAAPPPSSPRAPFTPT
jgi:hypothetical protein